MEAKYCVIILLWLAASRRGNCFVLSNFTAFTNTDAEKPADDITEATFPPAAAFPIAFDEAGLEKQSGEYAMPTEMLPPRVGGDIIGTTAMIQGGIETGVNRPTISTLVITIIVRLIIVVAFFAAVVMCTILVNHLCSKIFKNTIGHCISQLPSGPTDLEMSPVTYE